MKKFENRLSTSREMVPLPVDPEEEVHMGSRFKKNLMPKESITEEKIKIGCVTLEIWSHFRLTRKSRSTLGQGYPRLISYA